MIETLQDAKFDFARKHMEYHRAFDRIEFLLSLNAFIVAVDLALVVWNLSRNIVPVTFIVTLVLIATAAATTRLSLDLCASMRRWSKLHVEMCKVLREWQQYGTAAEVH